MTAISRRTFMTSVASLAALGVAPHWSNTAQAAGETTKVDAATALTVTGGQIIGAREANGTRVWRGIPFAEPPVGDLRGRAPRPVSSWAGQKETVAFGNQAVQQALSAGMPVPDAGAEDCLYLNVWAPEKGSDTPRPVLVWIHGGGYVAGSGSEAVYYGDDYAERGDLVYVSINYRLNGFGFLRTSLDADSANLALLDQVAALQWIQKNIEQFGGDPANVTVMGESAGAMAISTLIGSPRARGLFARAIIQSGGARPIYSAREAEEVLAFALAEAGLKPGEDEKLMALPLEELKRIFAAMGAKSKSILLGGEPFHPAIGDSVLPKHPLETLSAIPALIGHCENEGQTFAHFENLFEGLPLKVRSLVGEEKWNELARIYKAHARPERDPLMDLFSDSFTGIPSLRLADQLKGLGADVWSYRFDYQKASPIGAAHASDIAFTFGKPNEAPFPVEWTKQAQTVSERMRDSFIAFARTGNPQTSDLPDWPQHDPEALDYLRFDATPSIGQDFIGAERRAAWQDVAIDAV
ncbi:carboxylesterase/lipase family protein [Cohaesibacter marisflavi]|uniref:carboxylesterase/lipase family protein n=1 Tax=Cohaesibacter marisflavi TaxID=655353 RepID=UPI0029C65D8F|nr:carboxylesterase/lipase family protein [Cohaesibacter marisflavi]